MKDPTQEEWNRFIASQEHAQFLQSWEWGQFQRRCGVGSVRIATRDTQGEIETCALFLEVSLFGGEYYWYVPRGPVTGWSHELFKEMSVILQNSTRKPLFIRSEPCRGIDPTTKDISCGRRVIAVQPEREWILDLEKDEAALMAGMHQKTRYNIRLASKKNVQVRTASLGDDDAQSSHILAFYGFLAQTAHEKRYRLHNEDYYKTLITFFSQRSRVGSSPWLELHEALVDGCIVASHCVMYFGDTAYYLYGGSDPAQHAVMAPYALHHYALIRAKGLGFRYYNFGGIAPNNDAGHSLAGVTRFKKGFGGEQLLYPGTFDRKLHFGRYMLYYIGRPVWRLFHKVTIRS